MEKKKRWLINFLYYGIFFCLGSIILYLLFKKCLIVVLSYLTAILLRPCIDLILKKLHVKNKIISTIMTIMIFIFLYICFFLFVFFSCLFFIKTLSFLPDFIENLYQELLSHQYLISFFYTILPTNPNDYSKYTFNKYSLFIITCDEYGSFYGLSFYSFLFNFTFFISSTFFSKKRRKSLYNAYIFFYRDFFYHYKNI